MNRRTLLLTVPGLLLAMRVGAGELPDLKGLRGDSGCHPAPKAPRPSLHVPFIDPTFGTRVMQVTAPSQLPKEKLRVRHYYSKSNPWNADDSRMIAFSSDGGAWLYDTATWKPIKVLQLTSGDPEIQWHPTDPNLLYMMEFIHNSPNVRAFARYDVRTDRKTILHDFAEYDSARGKLEGNMDIKGRYYAFIGDKDKKLQAFVYDVQNDKKSQAIDVTQKMADDWISVSPSGKYVVMMGGDRSRVYDIEMHHLRDLPPGSYGHADLCTTADGRDVLVYDGADRELDHNRNINITDLETGKEGTVVRIGWRTTPHISCRNTAMPGWALVSTQGPDRWHPNFDFEVFWVKLDGSGDVRRLAHHHSDREDGGYFAEQHATSNRTGDKVIFASNWGGGEISDYLIDLAKPKGGPTPVPAGGAAR